MFKNNHIQQVATVFMLDSEWNYQLRLGSGDKLQKLPTFCHSNTYLPNLPIACIEMLVH